MAWTPPHNTLSLIHSLSLSLLLPHSLSLLSRLGNLSPIPLLCRVAKRSAPVFADRQTGLPRVAESHTVHPYVDSISAKRLIH
ncbi:hypothetical protein HanRHA438_Chr11g0513511 [Helianthus annuus]|nr:hypothetical protein HanRHA438_Chr11g0513511 [Helianthus annuus]